MNRKVIRFWAEYADGTQYKGATFAEWKTLPDEGFICGRIWYDDLTTAGEHYGHLLNGQEWHWVTPEMKYHNNRDVPTTREAILKQYPGASVKQGSWASDADYGKIHTRMLEREIWR